VEGLFEHTYLILFGKLAVGGLLALAVPPFAAMERGFYRSTATVYLLAGYLVLAGEVYLFVSYRNHGAVSPAVVAGWGLFALVFTAYVVTLFIELPVVRARVFPLAVFLGLISLCATAWGYLPDGVSRLAVVPFVASLLAGAAVTGAATTGMLLGHWYLIETGLDLAPLRRILAYCRVCLGIEIVAVLAGAVLLYAWPGAPWSVGFELAFAGAYTWLVVARVAAWVLAVILLVLIGKTLAIPQTMAATGLFYIEALVVAVGQISGHWILFRTNLPF
jgi:hypothetical protein